MWPLWLGTGQLWTLQKKAADDIAMVTCWAFSAGTDTALGQSISTWL